MSPTSVPAHRTTIEMLNPPPSEVEAGNSFSFRVKVTCAEGCLLRGSVTVMLAGEQIGSSELKGEGAVAESDDIPLEAPSRVGEAVWVVSYAGSDSGVPNHEASVLEVPIAVVPHRTSVAIWDVPVPMIGRSFSVRVGIKCSSECRLAGQLVEVR